MKLQNLLESKKNTNLIEKVKPLYTKDFLNAVYNIVDASQQHLSDTEEEEIKSKDICFDTNLKFIHKNGFNQGRIDTIKLILGLSDKTNSSLQKYDTDGYGIRHAMAHKDKFMDIIAHIPDDEKEIINQYKRSDDPLEYILLSLPFVINMPQYKRLKNNEDKYIDARYKTSFIFNSALFVLTIHYKKDILYVHTFYYADDYTKKQTIKNNNNYRKEYEKDFKNIKGS